MNQFETENRIKDLKNVDIRTIKKDQLTDIRSVSINEKLPLQERIMDFVEKIGNPYCFLVGDIVVKVEYEETDVTFEQRFERILFHS